MRFLLSYYCRSWEILKWKYKDSLQCSRNPCFTGLYHGRMATAFSELVRVDYVKVTREWNAESDGSLRKVRERDGGVVDAVGCRGDFGGAFYANGSVERTDSID